MKKLLAIAPYPYLPFFSGGQKLVARFLEYLGKQTDLSVISTTDNDWSRAKSYHHLPLLKPSFQRYFDPGLVKKINQEIINGGYETLIWEHPYFAWLAFRVKKSTGVRTIIHTHNIEYQRFRSTGRWWWPVLKIYEKWSFNKADLIFFTSPEDKEFAINSWKIKKENCIEVPYGVDIQNYPSDRNACREKVISKHGIDPGEHILFFNGLLDYKPNLDALRIIVNDINPLLMDSLDFRYKIIICGKGLPVGMNSLKEYADKNIIYAGFAEDIATYYKAADLFLNPVQSGGGIKTKMVESIAYGTSVIATQSGAAGIDRLICGNKLVVVPDNDWRSFANEIINDKSTLSGTPTEYYQKYYWGNIIENILPLI